MIETYEKAAEMYRDPEAHNLLKQNSRKVFRSVEQDYHTLKYKLQRLMCTEEDDAIFEVKPELSTTNIVVVPQTFIFFKANVSHYKPPAFLNITYDSESEQATLAVGEKTDMKVCYSNMGIKEPTDTFNNNS